MEKSSIICHCPGSSALVNTGIFRNDLDFVACVEEENAFSELAENVKRDIQPLTTDNTVPEHQFMLQVQDLFKSFQ